MVKVKPLLVHGLIIKFYLEDRLTNCTFIVVDVYIYKNQFKF